MDSGLIATLIEAPEEIKEKIPQDHLDACKAGGVPTEGNAAGKTGAAMLDLTGENAPPDPLPEGWTPKGIVAIAFSVLAAVIGCAVISWYGVGEIGKKGA